MRTIGYFVLLIFIILSFTSVSAVTINQGTVLNTTSSNSSITFSFNINVSNFTIESNYILLYEINFTNSTGTYTCDVNHSTSNSNLDSSQFCPRQSTSQVTGSVGGSTSYYLYESNQYSKDNFIEIIAKMLQDSVKEVPITKDRNTSIIKIKIHSKESFSGDLKISNLEKKPIDCDIPAKYKDYIPYKILKFDSTIDNEKIKNIYVYIQISKEWLQDNSIEKVVGIKCGPSFELLGVDHITDEKNSKVYELSSTGFSTWMILGIKKDSGKIQESAEDSNAFERGKRFDFKKIVRNIFYSKNCCLYWICLGNFILCLYWWLIMILIGLGLLLIWFIVIKKENIILKRSWKKFLN